MEKVKVSTDTLHKYLVEHDFTVSLLGDYMGIDNGLLIGCFRHNLNMHGNPRFFSPANIERMNNALVRIVEDMRCQVLIFGTDQTYTNRLGVTYDPGLIEPIKQRIGKFFKLRGMTERVLGWNRTKYNFVLSAPSSKNYGNITREDADRLNAELLAVAGMLSSYEVVADDALEGAANEIVASAVGSSVTDDESKQSDSRTTAQVDSDEQVVSMGLSEVTFATYTTKKGGTAPQIIGFSGEDDPRWKAIHDNKPKWASACWVKDISGNRVYRLIFGTRYMDAAKALCKAYNTNDRTAWNTAEQGCADCYEKAVADGKAAREAAKAERKARREATTTATPTTTEPRAKTYTKAEVVALIQRVLNGDAEALAEVSIFPHNTKGNV